MSRIAFSLVVCVLLPIASAQDSKLPRGQGAAKKPVAKPAVGAKATTKPKPMAHCHSYLATPLSPLVFQADRQIYYMARLEMKSGRSFRYQVFSFDLGALPFDPKTKKYFNQKKILSFDAPLKVALLPHGSRVDGFTVLNFKGMPDGCARGIGTGISIPYEPLSGASGKPARTVSEGSLAAIASNRGRIFVDIDKGYLRDIDIPSFQQRTPFKFVAGDQPIFWDAAKRQIYAWRAADRALMQYGATTTDHEKKVVLKPNQRLIRDGRSFALLEVDKKKNRLKIKEVRPWTAVASPISRSINMPKAYLASDASVSIDFRNRIALIYGGSPRTQGVWKNIWIYDYGKNKLVSKHEVGRGDAVVGTAWSRDGMRFLIFTQSTGSGLHNGVRYYDRDAKKWFSIGLTR